jgi:hypothetical protein
MLKKVMSSTPVLAFPDFSKEFVVEINAYDTGIGAVLIQEGHPIAYFSKSLSSSNQKLFTYEKEFLAVMMIVDKWRSYLHKNTFTIRTLITRAFATSKIRIFLLSYKGKQ